MKIEYVHTNFRSKSLDLIGKANEIIEKYGAAGYILTLRQLYYQMVARNYIPNTKHSYKNFGKLISDARLGGHVDWTSIVDRTRITNTLSHWKHPSEIITSAYHSYNVDYWEGQQYRPRVWIEKDALIGVVSATCNEFDIPYLACKGYMSQSAMWRDSQIILSEIDAGFEPVLIYLGDHDPSGMHISNSDIVNRMEIFEADIEVRRIALNMDQIEEKNPPPNWAKLSDSRATGYIDEFGPMSWELDALEPEYMNQLLRGTINSLIDFEQWDAVQTVLSHHKTMLKALSDNYQLIEDHLEYEGLLND